jgi:AraC-like DNA-binding protein
VIINEGIRLRVRKGKTLCVRIHYHGVARHTDRHQIEFWIGAIIRTGRHLTGRDLEPVRVKIMHRRPEQKFGLQSYAGGGVEAGADVDEIHFPAASFDYSQVTRDPYLNRLLVKYCDEALARRHVKASPFRAKVENAIAPLLPHGRARVELVAARLGMSPRTLARRLASEDVSFAEILQQLRLALAYRYLADRDLPISQIAWLLGYGEIGTFTHAFRRWTGRTPTGARARKRPAGRMRAGKQRPTAGAAR